LLFLLVVGFHFYPKTIFWMIYIFVNSLNYATGVWDCQISKISFEPILKMGANTCFWRHRKKRLRKQAFAVILFTSF